MISHVVVCVFKVYVILITFVNPEVSPDLFLHITTNYSNIAALSQRVRKSLGFVASYAFQVLKCRNHGMI